MSGRRQSDWGRLLDILLPAGGLAVVLMAYFDESDTQEHGNILCVAGYVFSKQNAERTQQKMDKVLKPHGLPYFRMSACAHQSKPFDKIDREDCIKIEKQVIAITKNLARTGLVVAVNEKDYERIMPKHEAVGHAYSFCAKGCLHAVQIWADTQRYSGDIVYIFESGHEHQREANVIMQQIARNPEQKAMFRYGGHTFLPKEKALPLGAADTLAWHWAKDIKRKAKGELSRRDYQALVTKNDTSYYLNADDLEGIADTVRRASSRSAAADVVDWSKPSKGQLS